MFGTFLAIFILYLMVPLWAGYNLDISDMVLHIANYKAIWGTPNPFGKMLDYPQLFYYNPIPPFISMPLILSFIIPTLIYFLSKEFVSRKLAIYPPLVWLVISRSPRSLILFGQMNAMVFVLLFLIYWIRRHPLSPLFLLPPLFGHNGSRYLVVALCGFAFLDYFFRDREQFPITFFGLTRYPKNNVLPNQIIISIIGLIGSLKLDKNRTTFGLLLLTLIPSLYFNQRGILIISAIAAISIVKLVPYDPKILYYPLCLIVAYGAQLHIQDEVYAAEYFHSNEEVISSAFMINGSYCYYPDCRLNTTSWSCSHSTIWKYNHDPTIPLMKCTWEQYKEQATALEIAFANQIIRNKFDPIIMDTGGT